MQLKATLRRYDDPDLAVTAEGGATSVAVPAAAPDPIAGVIALDLVAAP